MWKYLEIVNPDALAKSIKDMQCGVARFASVDAKHFQIPPSKTDPPEGYDRPPGFPDCCDFHKDIVERTTDWITRFPDCCAYHRKLLSASWFDKSRYLDTPIKVVTQVSYTRHIVSTHINDPDWYENITEYIEFNHHSFGQFPTGYAGAPGLNEYLQYVKHEVTDLASKGEFGQDKAVRIADFISNFYHPTGNGKIDLNQLSNIYSRWLKIFPFQTKYFQNLKSHFETQLPILKGAITHNRYLKVGRASVKTQSELLEFLVGTTKSLLSSIKTEELVDNGRITDTAKHTLELLKEKHRIDREALLLSFTKGEMEYVKILKSWMRQEKQFFKELDSLLDKEATAIKLQFPPVNEALFEDFTCDLYNARFPEGHYKLFGKRGDNQRGIDVLSIPRGIAIQCKKKDLKRKQSTLINELKKEFKSDIEKAMEIKGIKIHLLIFASTFDDSTVLEQSLVQTALDLEAPFKVIYEGWSTLSADLHNQNHIVKKYYGQK
jgi:hypothetical protein